MKVKIQNRSVYHKFAEVEIEIPNDVKDIQEWLIKNEHTYIHEMDASINESKYEFGSGVDDYRGMVEELNSSEWRFDCDELNIGGHLIIDMKENKLIEQLKYYYEIDLDNCNMTNQDWIKELAKCMSNPDAYRIQFFNELIEKKMSEEMKNLKSKTFFSIFDMDTKDYLYTGINSETERECLESYLMYRDDDYWGDEYPKNLSKAIKKEPKENILEDMNFCNFILEEHIEEY